MGYQEVFLPERSIGRAGCDLFLSHKDITVVMVPYERHSIFPKAVDALYRHIQIPFNLIVIEGCAPEEVRTQLEKHQSRHGNMTIIYTNHCPSLAKAFNLALPHLKTPYTLFIDNEIRFSKGTIETMLKAAQANHVGVVCPKDSMLPRKILAQKNEGSKKVQTVDTFGFHPCILMAQDVLRGMGKIFDEQSSPYTFGVDLIYKLRTRGVEVHETSEAKIEAGADQGLRGGDYPLYRVQWNRNRLTHSLEQLDKKWAIQLMEDPIYHGWLQTKIAETERPVGFEVMLHQVASTVREVGLKQVQNLAHLHWSWPKVNATR